MFTEKPDVVLFSVQRFNSNQTVGTILTCFDFYKQLFEQVEFFVYLPFRCDVIFLDFRWFIKVKDRVIIHKIYDRTIYKHVYLVPIQHELDRNCLLSECDTEHEKKKLKEKSIKITFSFRLLISIHFFFIHLFFLLRAIRGSHKTTILLANEYNMLSHIYRHISFLCFSWFAFEMRRCRIGLHCYWLFKQAFSKKYFHFLTGPAIRC